MLVKNKILCTIVLVTFVVTVMLFIGIKVAELEHKHCNKESCPICEIIYTVKSELKNLIDVNILSKILFFYSFLYINLFVDCKNILAKDFSLVKNKIRLND